MPKPYHFSTVPGEAGKLFRQIYSTIKNQLIDDGYSKSVAGEHAKTVITAFMGGISYNGLIMTLKCNGGEIPKHYHEPLSRLLKEFNIKAV